MAYRKTKNPVDLKTIGKLKIVCPWLKATTAGKA
jgi:hypothetical protein